MGINDLRNYGFNVDEAMELCIDDEDIYKEVLETALEEGHEKLVLMKELIDAKDYERYTIEAHGLKNAARQIGADSLSDMAKESELAGKAGNTAFLEEKSAELLGAYQKVVNVLEEMFA